MEGLWHFESKIKVVNQKDNKNKPIDMQSVDHFDCVKLVAT